MKQFLCALGLVLVTFPAPRATAQTLYTASGSGGTPGTLYTVNPLTGAATVVGPTMIGASPIGLTGLAFHPTTGVLYGVTGNATAGGATNPHSLVTIDPATGAAALVGVLAVQVGDITFDSTGTLYGWQSPPAPPAFLVTIDLATGAETPRGTTGLSTSIGNALAFAAGTLYLSADGTAVNPVLRTVDPATGNTTVGPTLTGAPQAGAMAAFAADPDGTLFGVNTNRGAPTTCNLVVVNPTTGVVTSRGLLPTNTDALAFTNSGIRAVVPTSFFPVTPCRLLDTRTTSSILAGATRTLAVTGGGCGVPAAIAAVSLNVTVTNVTAAGHLVLYAANQAVPLTSNLEFSPGQTRANNAIVGVATDGTGTISIKNASAGPLDVVVDVNGYFN